MIIDFYNGKRVLITGHNGFVGSWLSLWLSELGANIVGLSHKPPSRPYLFKYLNFNGNLENIYGDIRNLALLKKIIKDYEPEIIFHLAAQPILLRSYNDPIETYTTNIIGTINVLEAVRLSDSTGAVVAITSDKVYENSEAKAHREADILGGYDPYSSSKAAAELIVHAYRNSFFQDIGIATARAGNIIGGGDWGEYRIIPDIIRSCRKNRKLQLRHPRAIRPWTYILDVIYGYLLLGEKLYKDNKNYSEGWNFSSSYVKSTIELVKEFSKFFNIDYCNKVRSENHEEGVLLLDSSKSKQLLGWSPKFDFKSAVEETALWYKMFYEEKRIDISEYSKDLILKFENKQQK